MGKNKKVTEKVKIFYRGPAVRAIKPASEDDMRTIIASFEKCLPLRNKIFLTRWGNEETKLKLVVGLSASLRALKQGKTKAIIYDDTAANHLSRYLNEFARKQRLPIVQARRLIDQAPKFKLNTLLVVSLVAAPADQPDPIESNEFDELCQLLIKSSDTITNDGANFKPHALEKVPSSGKSRAKKLAKIAAAAAAVVAAPQQQTHVVKIDKLKSGKKLKTQQGSK